MPYLNYLIHLQEGAVQPVVQLQGLMECQLISPMNAVVIAATRPAGLHAYGL